MSDNTPTPTTKTNQDRIKELCGHLGGTLYNMPGDERVLDEQVQILNALFHTTLAERLNTDSKAGFERQTINMAWLKIALQIQRQCAETLRTRKAIEYMDNLTTLSATPPKNGF